MEYVHQAQYYETDQMGIIHHSNYIRWMEEARIAYMDEVDFPYKQDGSSRNHQSGAVREL